MDTKICFHCKKELPLDEFRWKNKAKGQKHSWCKECEKKRDKQYYQESLTRKANVLENTKNQKIRNAVIVAQYRESGCKKCGDKRSYVLDFHHRDSTTKNETINYLMKSGGEQTLLNELKKCDVLCANCHREFHYLNKKFNISYEDWLSGSLA